MTKTLWDSGIAHAVVEMLSLQPRKPGIESIFWRRFHMSCYCHDGMGWSPIASLRFLFLPDISTDLVSNEKMSHNSYLRL